MPTRFWNGFVMAKLSEQSYLCDSPFQHCRERSEAIIRQELEYA